MLAVLDRKALVRRTLPGLLSSSNLIANELVAHVQA